MTERLMVEIVALGECRTFVRGAKGVTASGVDMHVSAFVIDMTVADVVEIFERTGQLEAVACEVTPADWELVQRLEGERLEWSRAHAALPRLYPTVVGTTAGPPSPPPCNPPDPST